MSDLISEAVEGLREQYESEKKRLRIEYGELVDSVAEVLFRHDPMHLNFEHNTDEYEPEVGTILPRLKTCASAGEVTSVVHEEFQKWFGPDEAGAKDDYRKIAKEVWDLYRQSKRSRRRSS